MGLGYRLDERDEYEWVSLSTLPQSRAASAAPTSRRDTAPGHPAAGLSDWLDLHPLWHDEGGSRVLLVDLDNLRADPARWRARMDAVVTLARQADHAVLAGQQGAVQRARPHLAEFAAQALPVADGSDLADHALLDAAGAVREALEQVVLISNDGIFAQLAEHGGRLTVLSPGVLSLSDRLRDAATQVVDLVAVERAVAPS